MLRVISGSAKGHKLKTPQGNTTRPTTDRVKESLFNIIMPEIGEARVLDLFAGSGSLGIEALSRGAASSVFVDKNKECKQIIQDNVLFTKLLDKSEILMMDSTAAVKLLFGKGKRFELVFLDPPYNKELIQKTLEDLKEYDILTEGAIIVAEHDSKELLPEQVGLLKRFRVQKYGDTGISFYLKQQGSDIRKEE